MRDLTRPMREMLWTIAQHKYGWTHVSRYGGQLQVGDGLVRRGLARWNTDHHGRDGNQPRIAATDAGRALIAELFPVSPFILGTYDWRRVRETHGVWTPVDGVAA